MDDINYEGKWEMELSSSISFNISEAVIYFYRRNSKVYQIILACPQLGDIFFAPNWQRNLGSEIIFHMLWRDGDIVFRLAKVGNFLIGDIEQDGLLKQVKFHKCNDTLPELGKNTLILQSIWRYELLQKYKNYSNGINNGKSISFRYELKNNSLSVSLREKYKLDNLVSTDEFITMINMMKWVNSVLRHDGTQDFLGLREAASILETHPGKASCRGLAIVLCESLLAVGIKSRFVACWPAEQPFEECHVVCSAYYTKLNKWILLDPTNNLYLINAQGIPMGLMEFREALIYNRPFFINEDTNWNGKKVKKDQFADYMCKNLIRFDCMKEYFPGCDQFSKQRVTLIPVGYDIKTPDREYTQNVDEFWEYV